MTTGSKSAELRKTGLRAVGDLPWGTHFCHFYETKDDLLDVLIPYFKTGLANNEFCLWVVFDPLTVKTAADALCRVVPAADRHLAAGDLEILPYVEWYLRDGILDVRRVIAGWKTKLAQALARGYDGMRVNGSKGWLTERHWEDFMEYERALNRAVARQRMIVLCTYPLAMSRAAEIFDVARSHEFAIARRRGRWEVLETPELKQAKSRIQRLNRELERRIAERTRNLVALNEALKLELAERQRVEEGMKLQAQRLLQAQDEERRRIARELHDSTAQQLAALMTNLARLEAGSAVGGKLRKQILSDSLALVENCAQEIRTISYLLHPPFLDELGLRAALQTFVEGFSKRSGIKVTLRLPRAPGRLPPRVELALFRVIQEGLSNVYRHSGSTTATVRLAREGNRLVLEVQDEGCGLPKGYAEGSDQRVPVGVGIPGMRERLRELGGRLELSSGRQGTTLRAVMPLTSGRS